MPNYVILANWTDQGIKNVKDSVRRSQLLKPQLKRQVVNPLACITHLER